MTGFRQQDAYYAAVQEALTVGFRSAPPALLPIVVAVLAIGGIAFGFSRLWTRYCEWPVNR